MTSFLFLPQEERTQVLTEACEMFNDMTGKDLTPSEAGFLVGLVHGRAYVYAQNVRDGSEIMGKYASKYRQWFIGDRTKEGGERIGEEADAEIAEQQRVIDELKKNLKGVHYLLNRAKFDYITDIKLRDEFQAIYRKLLGENNA